MAHLFKKYTIGKGDGSPVDPNAQYFVLRLDTDPAARAAANTYADRIQAKDPQFAGEIKEWVAGLSDAGAVPVAEKILADVHNVWTIYGLNKKGTESKRPVAESARPQDWGHPRWHYFRADFTWRTPEGVYINHFHGWTDLVREPGQYPELFAQLMVLVMQPGRPAEICGRDFLREDDFWLDEWGPVPPVFDEDPEDYDYRDGAEA